MRHGLPGSMMPEQGYESGHRHSGADGCADQDPTAMVSGPLQDDAWRLFLPRQRHQITRQRLPVRGRRPHGGQNLLHRGTQRLEPLRGQIARLRFGALCGRGASVCPGTQDRDSSRSVSQHVLSHSSERSPLSARTNRHWCCVERPVTAILTHHCLAPLPGLLVLFPQFVLQGQQRPVVQRLDRSLTPAHDLPDGGVGQPASVLEDQKLLPIWVELPDRLP